MAAMLETPSRIWRRIEAVEDQDMPSLPSLPAFEDSADVEPLTSRVLPQESDENTDDDDLHSVPSPRHSTPAASQYNSTIRPFSSTNTTARLANSFGSRKSFVASRSIGSRNSRHDSFNTSRIPSLPRINAAGATDDSISEHDMEEESKSSVPDVYLPPPDEEEEAEGDELSITDALQSVSRTSSPAPFAVDAYKEDGTPKKGYDYSVSLKSESKVCF
ncbi:hypothetical protein P691DRAFT_155976 [Macrolepiota fuliginosa MF-IS2]|uniref:Uncharacterized protein n=1 Tax=Macrolepiota fuliginosa MF-IS2 TaxID=1400762 RepID=A0A9P5X912_9AGAR|nr:hypothetical protein P691DRAFT_155976 [Macrolepiota fuliginosa MF-IS2]